MWSRCKPGQKIQSSGVRSPGDFKKSFQPSQKSTSTVRMELHSNKTSLSTKTWPQYSEAKHSSLCQCKGKKYHLTGLYLKNLHRMRRQSPIPPPVRSASYAPPQPLHLCLRAKDSMDNRSQ
jgi:hypothetical protein